MANAASATCAWSETSDEGFDGIDAPRGWPAGNREPARRNRGRSDEPREKRRGFAQRNRRSTARIFGAPEKKSHVGGSDDWNLFFFSRPPRNERRRRASGPGEALVLDASGARAGLFGFVRVSIVSRARARAHLLFASRWFSAAFARPPPPTPRQRFPRGTTEGRFSCVAAPAARFPLPRFRAATARAGSESPEMVPTPRGTAACTRPAPASTTASRDMSVREGERMSGDAGNKSRCVAKRETRKRVFVSRRLGVDDVPLPGTS